MDSFEAAKDNTNQFDVNTSDPEAVESIAERRVTTKTRPQFWPWSCETLDANEFCNLSNVSSKSNCFVFIIVLKTS